MDSTTKPNPYGVTGVATGQTNSGRRIRFSTLSGLTIGGILLALVLIMSVRIPYLYFRYPGLTDPRSKPVDYWPSLEVELLTVAIVLSTPFILVIFVPSVLSLRRQLKIGQER